MSRQGANESYYEEFGRKKQTVFEAVLNKLTNKDNGNFVEGATFDTLTDVESVSQAAEDCDVVVLCVGEYTYTETIGNIDNLDLPDAQFQLAEAVFNVTNSSDKPVVVVYLGGRPRVMTSIAQRANAVLVSFLPGNKIFLPAVLPSIRFVSYLVASLSNLLGFSSSDRNSNNFDPF